MQLRDLFSVGCDVVMWDRTEQARRELSAPTKQAAPSRLPKHHEAEPAGAQNIQHL
jgi:hypothetical protein